MPPTRQLTAIMFTDIAGYTALMGRDEQKAFDLLFQNRHLQQPLIKEFNGTWIKEMGDGVLASFSTATDAVLCAGAIQRSCKRIPGLTLRIGIHLGDVVFDNNDVFGDGVNIASRIQALATIGSIWVSEVVSKNIANKKEISSTFIREEMLKNVKDPVRIYEVSFGQDTSVAMNDGSVKFNKLFDGEPVSAKSIAVLPFVNMSNDPEQEYFSDGITEDILNSLTHLKDLRVAGRTSSFHFKGMNIDLREIGQKLNVKNVLEGSVRRQGNKLRITAQLINVNDGFHIWSERYDRDMDDIFAIQDEIAYAITEKLKVILLEEEKAIIDKNPTANHEAYDLYLKGLFYFNQRGAGIIKAIEFFKQVLEKDPELTLAYTGMADCYYILTFWGVIPPHEAMPKAREYAEKAIQLQSSYAEAYTALAFINTFYDWDWKEAKKQFQHVFELNPNYAPAHYWYSYYLSFVESNFKASIQEAQHTALHLEPLVPVSHHILSIMYICAGQYEEGVRASKMAIELDATSFRGYRGLGLSLAGLHKYEEAIEALTTAVTHSLRQPLALVELSWVFSLTGNASAIQKIADELMMRSKTEYISPVFLCCEAYYSNNVDKAIEHIEEAFVQRDSALVGINVYPLSEFFRTDPRFLPYLKKMNFPE